MGTRPERLQHTRASTWASVASTAAGTHGSEGLKHDVVSAGRAEAIVEEILACVNLAALPEGEDVRAFSQQPLKVVEAHALHRVAHSVQDRGDVEELVEAHEQEAERAPLKAGHISGHLQADAHELLDLDRSAAAKAGAVRDGDGRFGP